MNSTKAAASPRPSAAAFKARLPTDRSVNTCDYNKSMLNGVWNIRHASIHDARAMAEVHTESFNSAYRGIFPEFLLNGLSVEKRESSWRDLLSGCEPVTMVGCDAVGTVVGFGPMPEDLSGTAIRPRRRLHGRWLQCGVHAAQHDYGEDCSARTDGSSHQQQLRDCNSHEMMPPDHALPHRAAQMLKVARTPCLRELKLALYPKAARSRNLLVTAH